MAVLSLMNVMFSLRIAMVSVPIRGSYFLEAQGT